MARNEVVVGTDQLAAIVDLTPRRLQQLRGEGMPSRGRGKWPLMDCLRWYIRYLRDKNDVGPALVDEKLRTERLKADKLEVEIKQLKGELIAIETVAQEVLEIMVTLRGEFLGLPGRLAMQLSKIDKAAECKRVLADEIRLTLNRSSEKLHGLAHTTDGSSTDEAAGQDGSESTGGAAT